MATDCVPQNLPLFSGPRGVVRTGVSRRLFLTSAALGALLPALLPKAARAFSDADALTSHDGWVLRADDLQRLGIK